MDVMLMENAANFIEQVQNAFNYYGEEGITHDPGYTIIGGYTEKAVNNFLDEYKKEIDYIIEFAIKWDIDPNEWELTDSYDRFKFAAMYIAIDLENEKEWQKENAA